MNIDFSKIVEMLGESAVAQIGAPLGLDGDQSLRLAKSLAGHMGAGKDLAVKGAAAEAGIPEDVTQSMMDKLMEAGKEKLLNDTGVTQQVEAAKEQAMAAVQGAAGGLLGRLFGRKG